MRIKLGDKVKILYGKDAGATGIVVKVLPKKMQVVVEGLNIYKRAVKGDGSKVQSQILSINKPLSVSKVMLICPSCGKATRIGFSIKDGGKNRVCKKCGAKLDERGKTADKVKEKASNVKLGLDKVKFDKETEEEKLANKSLKDKSSAQQAVQAQKSYRQVGDR